MNYEEHTRADTSFDGWMSECCLRWMSRNDEDAYDYPAWDWRGWYDEGLSVEQAVDRANVLLFGRPHGA
jgi:hypothetical protein